MVSIIIPTFNRAKLIGDTLDSILAQSYENWECLIIDDGSEDDTEKIIRNYINKDSRFKFYKRPSNLPKGANACRNFGFENSRGDYINWFDSDDQMEPDKLRKQLDLLKKYPKSPYCICQTQWTDKKSGSFIGLRSNSISSEKRFEDYLLFNIFWSILAPLWRRNFLLNNNIKFDEKLHQSQEYDFHLKALKIDSNYIFTNESLCTMYKHDDNLSNHIYTDDKKVISNLNVKSKIVEDYFTDLTPSGKLKYLEILIIMFKNLLVQKRNSIVLRLKKIIIKALKKTPVSTSQKLQFILRLNLMIYSYFLIGKGYNLLKPIKYAE
ncbi:glycosyltransferase family 2 protein [Winogradskyella maritima]|uniref:Glycosyltransferase family 2 protein n=1 Tax=Winogradskyella maritima TaxID=1517766 RepID=A0ABV8AHR9_9FLAO|nr:glycosyltransferase family 2 protein [Winogradskyella maritima]